MNYSYQREKIENFVLNSSAHPTAETVYENVRKEIPNISLGTVYRNLNKLSQIGKIKKIAISNNSDRFDKILKEHFHIHCIKCNKVEDVDYSIDKRIYKNIEQNKNYKILFSDLVFEGICNDCIKEGNEF